MQRRLMKLVALYEAKYPCLNWLYHCPNSTYTNVVAAVNAKRMGVRRGVWDLFLPYSSHRHGYNGLYIELKYGKNVLTPEEIAFREFADTNEFKTVVCYSEHDALKEILDYVE